MICYINCLASAGHTPADADTSAACFDGQPDHLNCAPAPQRTASPAGSNSRPRRSSHRSKSIRARLTALDFWPVTLLSRQHRRQLKLASQLLVGAVVTGTVATAVLIALRVVMQVSMKIIYNVHPHAFERLCWLFGDAPLGPGCLVSYGLVSTGMPWLMDSPCVGLHLGRTSGQEIQIVLRHPVH